MSILAAMGQSYHAISEEALQRAGRAQLGPGSAKMGARGAKSGKPWAKMARRRDAVVIGSDQELRSDRGLAEGGRWC